MSQEIGYGLIGCGSFGQFCIDQYSKLDDVRLIAVADEDRERTQEAARKFDMIACDTPGQLLARQDVDLVHIATPPFTHYELTIEALSAGKHVLCEKPLATSVKHGREMIAAAGRAGKVLAVDLIMRYDPLAPLVGRLVREKLLGEPIRAFLENYAGDERLAPDHWFWDRARSGGIFIEHGVHFFDLFEDWFGQTEVLGACQLTRPGNAGIVDQVQCVCRYDPQVLTTFYHGFHQSDRMDRQEFRIVCERGDIRLSEWLPTTLRIDAALLEGQAEAIAAMLPNARLRQIERFTGERRQVRSRHREYEVDALFTIESNVGMSKTELYGHVLRELLRDQVRYIIDPQHKRRLDEQAGLRCLVLAEEATRLADPGAAPVIHPKSPNRKTPAAGDADAGAAEEDRG
jgi:predicted dehydrogenase